MKRGEMLMDNKIKKLEERLAELEIKIDNLEGELSMKIDSDKVEKRIGEFIKSVEKNERSEELPS